MITAIQGMPELLRKSVTWDQGREMAHHAAITQVTGMPIYFCDPHSPWQRPTNENTNGLLRQYLPKKADLAKFSRHELEAFAAKLNNRPRKTLGFHTPTEALTKLLCEHSSLGTVTTAS